MTLIEYFVIAYYSEKKKSRGQIQKIINETGPAFRNAREEYDYIAKNYSSEYLTNWIRDRIKYNKQQFLDTYFPNN